MFTQNLEIFYSQLKARFGVIETANTDKLASAGNQFSTKQAQIAEKVRCLELTCTRLANETAAKELCKRVLKENEDIIPYIKEKHPGSLMASIAKELTEEKPQPNDKIKLSSHSTFG